MSDVGDDVFCFHLHHSLVGAPPDDRLPKALYSHVGSGTSNFNRPQIHDSEKSKKGTLRFIGKVAAYCLPLFPTFCGVCTASASAHDQMKGFDTMLDNIQPDDVLFHELFHAYRCMKGIFEEIPTGDTWDYTEEQMAIIATNVSVSEIGRSSSLRGDHSVPFHSLKENKGSFGDQTVGRNFYNDNFKIVDQMAREMPEFTGPLEKTEAASHVADWNPFRERILFDKGRAMYNTMGSVALDMIVDGH